MKNEESDLVSQLLHCLELNAEGSIKEESQETGGVLQKNVSLSFKNKMPLFFFSFPVFSVAFLLCILVNVGLKKQNKRQASKPHHLAVTCVVPKEERQATLHQLLSVGQHISKKRPSVTFSVCQNVRRQFVVLLHSSEFMNNDARTL